MLVPLANGSLYCERLGHGRPMLLMHGGLGLDHTVFRPWLDPLADSAELIFYDHLANGRSPFDGAPEELTHELWVDSADQLRAHLGHERVVLFGHSYGALLALEYALRHPDRLDALILSNVAPALDYPEAVMANARRKAPDDATFQAVIDLLSGPLPDDDAWAAAFRRVFPLYFHDYDPARHDAVLDDVAFRVAPMNRSTFECLPSFAVEDRIGGITVPTLVLSGADDWIMPPEHAGDRVAAAIPDAQHVVFQHSGHWPFVEENDRFIEVVRGWLAQLDARSTMGAPA